LIQGKDGNYYGTTTLGGKTVTSSFLVPRHMAKPFIEAVRQVNEHS
jgi:hypothetical protein